MQNRRALLTYVTQTYPRIQTAKALLLNAPEASNYRELLIAAFDEYAQEIVPQVAELPLVYVQRYLVLCGDMQNPREAASALQKAFEAEEKRQSQSAYIAAAIAAAQYN